MTRTRKRRASLSITHPLRETGQDCHRPLQDLSTLSFSLPLSFSLLPSPPPLSFSLTLSFIFATAVARFVKLVCVNNCPLSSRISIRTPLPSEPSAFRRSGNYFILPAACSRPLVSLPPALPLDRTFIFPRFPIGSFPTRVYGVALSLLPEDILMTNT